MDEDLELDDDFTDVATETIYEKRIGRRHPIDRVPIGWRVDRPLKGIRRSKRRHEQGVLLDLSMSGAKVQAPTSPDLAVGRKVTIEIEGLTGEMRIRRIAESDVRGESVYGLEFLDATADMARRVHYRLIGQFEVAEEGIDDLADLYDDDYDDGWGGPTQSGASPIYEAFGQPYDK
jgi:hypothetical protein